MRGKDKFAMEFLRRVLPSLLFFSLLGFAGLLLFSVNYSVIKDGLDPSWGFAVNQFSHGPLKFGVDLVFTYGPLAYLAIPQHVGNNIAWAAVAHIAVWCVFMYLVVDLWQTGRRAGTVIYLIGMILSNRLFYFYWDYFLIAIALLLFLHLLDRPGSHTLLTLLSLLIGLCFLVKFTAFIVVLTMLGIYTVWRAPPLAKMALVEGILIGVAFVSGPIAYVLYNPSLSGLGNFLRGSLQESIGHSAAMSLPATYEVGMRGAVLFFALIACAFGAAVWKIVSPVGAAMTVALTWTALKHGYVRSDTSHEALFCCFGILILAFIFAQIRYTPRLVAVCIPIAVLFSAFALQGASASWRVWSDFWWTPDANLTQALKLLNWGDEMQALDAISKERLSGAPINEYSETLGRSRVLFFPWEIAYGAHQKFTTIPLYTAQAYLAYTHYLDQQSAAHLEQSSPPIDYVFFQWATIDSRNPLSDVPATWNALFSRYEPASSKGGLILLKRRVSPLSMVFRPSSESAYAPGAWISIPERTSPVGLRISLTPTVAGTLRQTFYKLDAVYLEFRTRSGMASSFRVIPDNLSSPFPINSLPVSPQTLEGLWTRNEVLDPIASIRLAGPGLGQLHCDSYQFYDVDGTSIRVLPANPAVVH